MRVDSFVSSVFDCVLVNSSQQRKATAEEASKQVEKIIEEIAK
jgi:hypothetical protein